MKVAILWLVNEKGEILLSQRAAHMSSDASMWGPSVSGKIDEGETAKQASIREASEELGIGPAELRSIQHLHDAKHHHSDGHTREFNVFVSRVDSSLLDRIRLEPNEVARVKWITLNDLQKVYEQNPQTIIVSSDKIIWKEIFESLAPIVST